MMCNCHSHNEEKKKADKFKIHIVLALTLPQSLWLEELAEAILAFFLLSFSFSPASTTSLTSLRQPGQYLRNVK